MKASSGDGTVCLVVTLTIRLDATEDFIAAIRENSAASIADESGCLSFTVAQRGDSPSDFVFYEVYHDDNALAAHRTTAHYAVWREAVDRLVEPGTLTTIAANRLWSLG